MRKRGRPSQWVSLGELCEVLGVGVETIRRRRVGGILKKHRHFLELRGVKLPTLRFHLTRCIETICGLEGEEACALIADHRQTMEAAE